MKHRLFPGGFRLQWCLSTPWHLEIQNGKN
jgi:hypothetical protein